MAGTRRTALITLENSSNLGGGTVYPIPVAEEIGDRAQAAGIPVFLDGARIFNAAVALDLPVAALARKADAVMFSLSKGLGAPVGSVLVGSRAFIAEGRRVRKMLGGAMRQAGVLAAAGLVALDEGPGWLGTDHEHAQRLAAGLADIPGLRIDPATVQTNIVLFEPHETGLAAHAFAERLAARGVRAHPITDDIVRMVTHRDVDRAGCDRALAAVRAVVADAARDVRRGGAGASDAPVAAGVQTRERA